MKHSLIVFTTIYLTLNPVLYASKSKCTDYYLILEEKKIKVNESMIYTSYEPLTKNYIDWNGLKKRSQNAYDEIHRYSDCILELFDCKETVTDNCQNLNKTSHLGKHKFITSTINNTDDLSITFTTESIQLRTEPITNNNYLTTTAKKIPSEFNDIDETTENRLNNEFSVDIVYMDTSCSNNATNILDNYNEESEITWTCECQEIEIESDCEVEAIGKAEPSTKLSDFNVTLLNDHEKSSKKRINVDITSSCNKNIVMNNKSNEYILKCDKISNNTLEIVNEITTLRPFIGTTLINNTTENVYTTPDDFRVILLYHNKQCNANKVDITNNCLKITNLQDTNTRFSLECQMIKDNCEIHENKTEFDIDSTTTEEPIISSLNREKEKNNKSLIFVLGCGVVAAVGGILALAMIAKFLPKLLQSASFHVPDDPYFTHPDFRDDVEESPC